MVLNEPDCVQAETLGEAKIYADKNAKRDGCRWFVTTHTNHYSMYKFLAYNEFTTPSYKGKKILYIGGKSDNLEAVYLTPDEKMLLIAILGDKDDRKVFEGSEKTKDSLWSKLMKSLGAKNATA